MERNVDATEAALQLIKEIQDEHGPVMFHQSGGCLRRLLTNVLRPR